MMKAIVLAVLVSVCGLLATALPQSGDKASQEIPAAVQAVFKSRCVACHTGSKPPRGLSLIPGRSASILGAPSAEVPSLRIVDTDDPSASYLLKKVRREAGISGKPMPPSKALSVDELRIIEDWILGLKKS
jgi:mono/diheme cytochrome c family protein